MEFVEGGELFDYLIQRNTLSEAEALHFFQQMVFGVDFCHRHMIWYFYTFTFFKYVYIALYLHFYYKQIATGI